MNMTIKETLAKKKYPTICLNMIVKNESKVIIDTLLNLTKYINFDYWVISDTGSTDGTQQMIEAFFWNKGIPGEIVSHEWQDFGYNRTKALEAAYNKTDYLLIFDADDSLQGNFNLPFDQKPYADRYMLKIGQGFEYIRPLLINNRKRWAFKGVLHEYLANLEPVNEEVIVGGNYHVESGRTGNRSQNPDKYYNDAVILKNAYAKELLLPDKGLSGRYAFYCARSFKDAGDKYNSEAIEWYKKVLDIPNHWSQEKYYSALEIGYIYKNQNKPEEAVNYFLKTIEYDAERIEGIISAVEHFYQNKQYILVNALYHKFKNYKLDFVPKLGDKLFVNKHYYNDRLEFFNGIIGYFINDKASGYTCCKQVLINQQVGENELSITLNNLMFYRENIEKDKDTLSLFKVADQMIYKNNEIIYNSQVHDLWNMLFKQNRLQWTVLNRHIIKKIKTAVEEPYAKTSKADKSKADTGKADKSKIIITFTTCKRLDLFKETINSILNQWTDVDLITSWFCVDDNSSPEDRHFMKSTYHWMDYYMKTPSEKGHRASMNIIWCKLHDSKPDYWIHMEDDFLFYHPMDYVTQAITALKNKTAISMGIKQIVFNRNYAETVDNYKSKGHLPTSLPNILLHDHKPNESITHYQNSHFWPHYSFRPSMTEVKAVLLLGNYDSPNQFFERDYADQWHKANYKTAFFDRITHRHIGRLTSEISTGLVKNAYELNNEKQFNSMKNKYMKLLNLERRPDRKTQMMTLLDEVGLKEDYGVFKAVDGKEIEPTLELKLLFDGNDFGTRRGVIGCALSHLKMWRELIADKDHNYYVIFEDDCRFVANFKEQFAHIKANDVKGNFNDSELLFLGYSMRAAKRESVKSIYESITDASNVSVHPLNKDLYIGGTFAYSVNKIGAKKLVDYIEANGIKHGIDYLIKIMPDLNLSEAQPQLVFSDWNEAGEKAIDTDIQNNYDSIDFTKTIEDRFDFILHQDQIGHDLYFHRGLSLGEKMVKALKDTNCVGFNTLGFFKRKIENLTTSQYFGKTDGIYVKKIESDAGASVLEAKQPINVKLMGNWCTSEQLCYEWSNMCNDNDYTWTSPQTKRQIKITWKDNDPLQEVDYYVIINHPREGEHYKPEKTLVFQMEPWVADSTKNWGVKTWGEWAKPDPTKYFKVFTHQTHLNNVQWQIDYSFYDKSLSIDNESKQNKIATLCSYKNFDTGHLLRNNFIKFVEQAESNNNSIDVWGQQNFHDFINYHGALKDDDKYNVYAKYKYCFAAENNAELNYATEKIWEPILCESLCFYWGCPNLEDYLDPRAFVRLPLEDPAKSFAIIQQAIAEDWWSQRIDVIKQMKEKILNELGFFPLLERLLVDNT